MAWGKTTTEQQPTAPWTGPRWEYRYVKDPKEDELNELGAQGWEVVGISEPTNMTQGRGGTRWTQLILKRPATTPV